MAKISEYSEIESIGSDAMFIAETEDGSYKVPQSKLVDLIEANSTKDYEQLDNKPQINSVELDGDTSLDDLGVQADLASEDANGDVAENRLYRDIVGSRNWSPGNAVFANGTLTITYSTTNDWGGGGFFINLFHGMPTEVRVKIESKTEYRNMWFVGISTVSPQVNLNFADAQSWGGRMVDDGEYITFTIPASIEEQYGAYVSIINQNRNVTGGIVLSDLRVYPNKALDAKYVGEALGTGGATELADLTDINLSSVSNNQILKYDSSTGKWKNANESGGGGGADDLNDLSDVNITSASNGQVLKYNSSTHKWENEDEQTADLTNIPHFYTAYYLEQTTSVISLVITELDDNAVVPTAGDLIALRTISSDVFSDRKPDSVKLYASDEETLLATKSLQIKEQFMPNTDYLLYFYGSSLCSLTDNVNSVAQVNSLIDAKINALGFAEQEAF